MRNKNGIVKSRFLAVETEMSLEMSVRSALTRFVFMPKELLYPVACADWLNTSIQSTVCARQDKSYKVRVQEEF